MNDRAKRWISLAALCLLPAAAHAEMALEGELPAAKNKVSLHAQRDSPSKVLSELAKQAGWNVVLQGPIDAPGEVTVDVEQAEASDVLALVLSEGSYRVKRQGELLLIRAEPDAASPEVRADAEATSSPQRSGSRDRSVFGQNVTIAAGEHVHDVTVTGGSIDVYGVVEGDLVVTGGNAEIHEGGEVRGDTLAVGGRVHVAQGGKALGDNKVLGGMFLTEDGAVVGGDVEHTGSTNPKPTHHKSWSERASDLFGNFTFLFVLGALFLAGAPERMSRLRGAFAARPLAHVAYGVVATIASSVALIALCVTVIGIPFALVLALLGAVAVVAALSATLTTAGTAVLGHRTQNPYVHLAAGAALFAVAGILPWVGGWLQLGAMMASVGVLVTTRLAGLWRGGSPGELPPASPYR